MSVMRYKVLPFVRKFRMGKQTKTFVSIFRSDEMHCRGIAILNNVCSSVHSSHNHPVRHSKVNMYQNQIWFQSFRMWQKSKKQTIFKISSH